MRDQSTASRNPAPLADVGNALATNRIFALLARLLGRVFLASSALDTFLQLQLSICSWTRFGCIPGQLVYQLKQELTAADGCVSGQLEHSVGIDATDIEYVTEHLNRPSAASSLGGVYPTHLVCGVDTTLRLVVKQHNIRFLATILWNTGLKRVHG